MSSLTVVMDWYQGLPKAARERLSLANLHDLSKLLATAEAPWRPMEREAEDEPLAEYKAMNARIASDLRKTLARVAELEAALEPFAMVADRLDGLNEEAVVMMTYDDPEWGPDTVCGELFVRPFRIARAALPKPPLTGGV